MDFSAAIFDLDGVLADTAKLHLMAWERLLNELGLPLMADAEHKTKGLERLASLDVLLGDHQTRFSAVQKLEFATRKNYYYLYLTENLSSNDLLPGAKNLLENLKNNDIPIALASASKNAAAVIKSLAIKDYFDFVVDASLIAESKPSPEIFLAAANGLSVSPLQCIAFEDAPAGVAAVKAAEMYAIGIGRKSELPTANRVFDSLEDFLREESLSFSQRKLSLG